MKIAIDILLAGFVVCGCLLYRATMAARAGSRHPSDRARADDRRRVDVWQQALTLLPPGYVHWREKLRRAEETQRPQEERN